MGSVQPGDRIIMQSEDVLITLTAIFKAFVLASPAEEECLLS